MYGPKAHDGLTLRRNQAKGRLSNPVSHVGWQFLDALVGGCNAAGARYAKETTVNRPCDYNDDPNGACRLIMSDRDLWCSACQEFDPGKAVPADTKPIEPKPTTAKKRRSAVGR